MKDETYGYISEDITLLVGEKRKVKSGLLDSITIIYSGMISKETFSITVLYGSGYQGYSYILYFSKESKTIKVGKETFSIVSVNPDQLILRK
jgi:hypothetical protein